MTTRHCLPSELTIYTVGELHPVWLTWVEQVRLETETPPEDERFLVDAQAVNEVDAAGVQLLLSLANALTQAQRVLQLHGASSTLARACNSLGVQALLAPDEATDTEGAGA